MIQAGLELVARNEPLNAEAIDGRALKPITHGTMPTCVRINGKTQEVAFQLMNSPNFPTILGMPWLESINPIIDWNAKRVQFTADSDARV